MNIVHRIKRSVSNRECDVFLRADFKAFGSAAGVGRALNQLQKKGVLIKIGRGIYCKAKLSVLSGLPIPERPLEVLASEVFKRLGVEVAESRLTREYNSGRSTQIPAGIVFSIGKRRIVRKIGFNGRLVQYERT